MRHISELSNRDRKNVTLGSWPQRETGSVSHASDAKSYTSALWPDALTPENK